MSANGGRATTGDGPRALVVGGGIAGLSAAYDLRRGGWSVEVCEAEERWGGKILSSPVGDRLVDAGPDTFLARVEPGRQLCEDLGLADELTSPVAPVPAYLVRHGALHELPSGSMLGVPTDLDALARSGLVSPEGVARAKADLDRPPTEIGPAPDADISVGRLCRERLGDEVTDRLIDPLLGGINASDIDRLSLRAGAPLLSAAIDRSPSLIEGLRAVRPASGPTLGTAGSEPVFYGLPGGIARIIEALVAALDAPSTAAEGPRATLRLGTPITSLDPLDGAEGYDAIVVAAPAFGAADLVKPFSPTTAEELASLDYASVAQVTVELPVDGVERELDASGILFPRVEGTVLTASTWFSTKWAHYRRPGTVLIRLTSGRFGDERPAGLSDDELAKTLLGELSSVLAITGRPTAVRVHRWPRAFPQYTPGHATRVKRAAEALGHDAPSVRLVGAPYHGIGIPACIDSGRRAARELIEQRV